MSITTRRAEPADTAALHEVAAQTFGLACPPGTTEADIDAFVAEHLSVASFERYLSDPARTLLIAEALGVPVGYTMLVTGPIGDPEVAAVVDASVSIELSKCYVLPDAHGSGTASTLMTATLAVAAETGPARCWLGVNQKNERAGRFYAKHGFVVVGTKHFRVGSQWHDDHIRVRPLP